MKVYEVFIQDIWNNNYHLGFYKSLKDAVPDINEYLRDYDIEPLKDDELHEYPSTFCYCFDKDLTTKDEEDVIYIRGFIFENFEEEIKHLQ